MKLNLSVKEINCFEIPAPSLAATTNVKNERDFEEDEEDCENVKNEKSNLKSKYEKSFENKPNKKLKLDPTLQQPAYAKGKEIFFK